MICTMIGLNHALLWTLLPFLGVSLWILEGGEALELTEQVKDLSFKQLQSIPVRDVNSTVTSLLLRGNQISLNESDRLALLSYSRLTRLYLDNNCVSTIKDKYFTDVAKLHVLSLSGNNISRLDPEAFSGQANLTQLDLSNNSLRVFPYQLLKTLNLQLLNIKGNPWNCSCDLLLNFSRIPKDRRLALAQAPCASPQSMLGLDLNDAVVKCFSTQMTAVTEGAPVKTTTVLKPTVTAQINNSRIKDEQEPVTSSNSWKFTISVVALGLTMVVLLICAIKGPSWYKLFHNYRHRRLRDEPTGTTVFHHTPRQQQTFTFQQEGTATQTRTQEDEEEEDEDGYFEDPYIRREDV